MNKFDKAFRAGLRAAATDGKQDPESIRLRYEFGQLACRLGPEEEKRCRAAVKHQLAIQSKSEPVIKARPPSEPFRPPQKELFS